MGLDNGVVIKHKSLKGYDFLKDNFKYLCDEDYTGDFEFGYWRNCWNIRHRFFEVFSDKYDEDTQRINFKIIDIPVIIDGVLKYFLNEDNWDDNRHEWWEILPSIASSIAPFIAVVPLATSFGRFN